MKKEEKEMVLDSKELIEQLQLLISYKQYKRPNPLPTFNTQEIYFIRDLIFRKPDNLLFLYLAYFLMNETKLKHLPIFNVPSIKKLRFIMNILSSRSATEAAIKAGYSIKTAKQQASRLVKEIQGFKRIS